MLSKTSNQLLTELLEMLVRTSSPIHQKDQTTNSFNLGQLINRHNLNQNQNTFLSGISAHPQHDSFANSNKNRLPWTDFAKDVLNFLQGTTTPIPTTTTTTKTFVQKLSQVFFFLFLQINYLKIFWAVTQTDTIKKLNLI